MGKWANGGPTQNLSYQPGTNDDLVGPTLVPCCHAVWEVTFGVFLMVDIFTLGEVGNILKLFFVTICNC